MATPKLAVTHSRIGIVRKKQHDNGGALVEYRKLSRDHGKAANQYPEQHWLAARGRHIFTHEVGSLLQDQGELSGALKEFQAELAIRDQSLR